MNSLIRRQTIRIGFRKIQLYAASKRRIKCKVIKKAENKKTEKDKPGKPRLTMKSWSGITNR